MGVPDVFLSFKDGALGILPAETDQLQLVLATCTDGAANVLVPVTEKDQVTTQFGSGLLVECCALKLEIGGGPVYAMRIATADDGAVSVVVPTGVGAPALTVSGTPYDFGDVRVFITTAGDLTSARFTYSLDAGVTMSPEVAVTPTFPLPNTGLTLNFPPGSYKPDHSYSFAATPPTFTASGLNDAFDKALHDRREWGIVHIVGAPSLGTDDARALASAGLAAAVETKMKASEGAYRYARAVIEAPNVSDAALLKAFGTLVAPHVAVAAGYGTTLSSIDETQKLRSAAWAVLAQLMRKPIGKDPAQVEIENGTGPLPAALTSIARDERVTPSLDAARFLTVRTHIGLDGFYVTNFPLFSAVGSDLVYIQHGQVLDHGCKIARGVLLRFLSRDLDLNANGTLDEGEAQAIEDALASALRTALVTPGHVSAVVARVNRTDDVLATQRLRGSFGIQPKFYPKVIAFDFGFTKTVPVPTALAA